MLKNKKGKKEHLEKKNYQKNLQQKSYSSSQTKNIIRNIRQNQRGIGDIGKETKLESEER